MLPARARSLPGKPPRSWPNATRCSPACVPEQARRFSPNPPTRTSPPSSVLSPTSSSRGPPPGRFTAGSSWPWTVRSPPSGSSPPRPSYSAGRVCRPAKVNHHHIAGGKLHARVRFGDFRVVPLRDLAEKDTGQGFRGEVQLTGDTRNIVGRNIGAQHCGEVEHVAFALGLEFSHLRVIRRAVGGAEIDGTFGHLLNPTAGTDRLIIDFDIGVHLMVIAKPFGVHGIRKRRTRSS